MSKPYTVQRLLGGYAIKWTDDAGKPHRRRLAATDPASAAAEARALWLEGDGGTWTVGRIVAAYLLDREAAGIVSLQRLKDAWKAMRSFWSPVLPENIDDELCRTYQRQRHAGPGTVRKELSMLSVALRFALNKKLIERAPTVWRPLPPARVERHLTHDQFRRFLAGCASPHMKLYAALAVCTAARPTAVLQMTWDRVDMQRRLIDLNPTGRVQTIKRRPIVPINDFAFEALTKAYSERTGEAVIAWAGGEIASIKKAFQAASRRSGVSATPYTLRHTAAVWMAEMGTPMAEISQFLGHTSLHTTTEHYARFSPGYLRTAANAIRW